MVNPFGVLSSCLFKTCYASWDIFKGYKNLYEKLEFAASIDPPFDHPIEECEYDETFA